MGFSAFHSEHEPATALELLIRFDAAVLERHFDVLFFRKQVHVLVRPLGAVARSQQAFELQNGKALVAQFGVQLRTFVIVPQPIEQHPVLLDCVLFLTKRFELAHTFLRCALKRIPQVARQ
jgi:hypothetical protein